MKFDTLSYCILNVLIVFEDKNAKTPWLELILSVLGRTVLG